MNTADLLMKIVEYTMFQVSFSIEIESKKEIKQKNRNIRQCII